MPTPLTIFILLLTISQVSVGLNCTGDEDGGCQEVVCPGDSEPLSPEGGCKCVPARCHDPPPCPSGLKPTLKKKASLKPGDCCDIFECPPFVEDVDCNQVVCPEEEIGEPCPIDSYKLPAIQRDGECCSQSQGCACLPAPCPVPACQHPSQLKILTKGDGRPGTCCPIYQCTSHSGKNGTCIVEGKEIEDGGKWSPNKCSVCRCEKGLMLCSSVTECPPLPDDCEDSITPPDSCCPVCASDNAIAESLDSNGCWLTNGTFKANGSTWDMDDCTNCTCVDGKRKCHATLCLSPCINATIVKGKCCPICNGSTDFVLPQHCPLLTDCPLKCKDGFARDETNCFFCQCRASNQTCIIEGKEIEDGDKWSPNKCSECKCDKGSVLCSSIAECPPIDCENPVTLPESCCPVCQDSAPTTDNSDDECLLDCSNGFKRDDTGKDICECINPKPCGDLSSCQKKCKHGYKTNSDGCEVCKCCKTLDNCNKICPHGFKIKAGCPTCSCQGASDVSNELLDLHCITEQGERRDDGESWEDHCRQCYCSQGKEMCTLMICPKIDCPEPLTFSKNSCCPTCPGSKSTMLGIGEGVCFGEGGSLKREGEEWSLGNCVKCRCLGAGRVVCSRELCPPAPCLHPVSPPVGSCCSYCPPLPPPYPSEQSCGDGHDAGTQWRESECKSCVCINGVSTCYDENCDESPCATPVIVKNQCCPICSDGWVKQIGGCRIRNITFTVGAELELEPCLRCTCLPGPYLSCVSNHCSQAVDDNKWWIIILSLVSILVFSCFVVFLIVHHYRHRAHVLKLEQPYQPTASIKYSYHSVPSYDMKPPI